MNHIATIERVYAGLKRGDPSALLEVLHEDVQWEFGSVDHAIPWLPSGRGRVAAERFLQRSSQLEFHEFVLHSVLGRDEWVVALFCVEFTVRSTGRRVREECEAQIWKLDASGKVIAVRHAADTHQHWQATESATLSVMQDPPVGCK